MIEIRSAEDTKLLRPAIMKKIRKVEDLMLRRSRAAAIEIVAVVAEGSRQRSPVDTGALRASHKTDVEEAVQGNSPIKRISGVVQAGGTTPIVDRNSPDGFVDYAVEVHEDMTRTSGPKYLERGLADKMGEVRSIVEGALSGRA